MIKKTLTAIIAATALFGFNANSFAQTYYDNSTANAKFGLNSNANAFGSLLNFCLDDINQIYMDAKERSATKPDESTQKTDIAEAGTCEPNHCPGTYHVR